MDKENAILEETEAKASNDAICGSSADGATGRILRCARCGQVSRGVQSSDSHKEFCAKEGLSFKLLSDTHHGVSSAYGSVTSLVVTKLSARHTFLINPEGVVVKEFLERSGALRESVMLASLEESAFRPCVPVAVVLKL